LNGKILLVEDADGLVVTLTDRLHSEGYRVKVARDGKRALDQALHHVFDLIILDIMLPQMSGMDVCRELRQNGVSTPVLMLTARAQTVDKVLGLKTGADDYVTKPFEMAELLARMEALLRRAPSAPVALGTVHQIGSIRVDLRRAEVWRQGKSVALSAREFQLLSYFIAHRGATLSRRELLKEVWGYDSDISTRTVDVHVAGLRQKLESDPKRPQLILTRLGLGYKFSGGFRDETPVPEPPAAGIQKIPSRADRT
jgi:two-component system, OmpR family, alkaline phosphatase synthesis response regulator PhoP